MQCSFNYEWDVVRGGGNEVEERRERGGKEQAIKSYKEKQLQRYEANNFGSVIFKDLLRFLEAVGLEITVEISTVQTIKKKSHKRHSK